MSDVSQGPGWWQASDGRWYPPETHPLFTPPPPSVYGFSGSYSSAPHATPSPYATYGPAVPAGPPGPRTSGLAIASFVCSLAAFILLGVPAVVGIILGFVALAKIRKSDGSQTGRGLALGGIIVGVLEIAAAVVLVLALVSFVHTRLQALQIPGAAGYRTFSGPSGKPLAVGKPWGERCQPIVFEVGKGIPQSVYTQLQQVVQLARNEGVDVTLATQKDSWFTGSLYPPGLTSGQVKFVALFPDTATPPLLRFDVPEHIAFQWNAKPSPDGRHEIVTYMQADLYLKALTGPASIRRAARQLVAFSQGVAGSSASGSGIADGSGVDSFSPRDIAAMELMSGCHFRPS
jgi:hypothetical protein